MTTIENEFLKVSVREKGAELTSIYNKVAQIEHLWQADPLVWPWHAPNLFPVIGESVDKQILVDGTPYKMERHGFARQSAFALMGSSNSDMTYSLTASKETLQVFPYKFELKIHYQLKGKQLILTYSVVNQDEKPIYFSIGGHPAFNVPFQSGEQYPDYFLEFSEDTALQRHLLSDNGLFTGETEPVPMEGHKLHLSKDLFSKDALVFKNLKSRKVSLQSKSQQHRLTVTFPDFNYLGIWAKPGADFVCIEPWIGCADTEGRKINISQKEDIQHLEPGNTFAASFSIEVS
jgi:galactose mutarotase-like enzyme